MHAPRTIFGTGVRIIRCFIVLVLSWVPRTPLTLFRNLTRQNLFPPTTAHEPPEEGETRILRERRLTTTERTELFFTPQLILHIPLPIVTPPTGLLLRTLIPHLSLGTLRSPVQHAVSAAFTSHPPSPQPNNHRSLPVIHCNTLRVISLSLEVLPYVRWFFLFACNVPSW